MKKTVYGYIRVSSKDQNEDRQVIAMKSFGVLPSHMIIEKQSGKDFNENAKYTNKVNIITEIPAKII